MVPALFTDFLNLRLKSTEIIDIDITLAYPDQLIDTSYDGTVKGMRSLVMVCPCLIFGPMALPLDLVTLTETLNEMAFWAPISAPSV